MSGILQGRSELSTALLILIVFGTKLQWAVKAGGGGDVEMSVIDAQKHKSGGKRFVNLPYGVFSLWGLSKVKSMILCQHRERLIFRFW